MSRPRVRDYCRFSWLQYVSTNKSTRVECKVGREGRLVVLESDGDEEWERGDDVSWKSMWLALPLARISRGKDKEF